MRALEMRSMIGGSNFGAEKTVKCHQERLKQVRHTIDTSIPSSFEERLHHNSSPSKKGIKKIEGIEKVSKDNLLLAKRIFKIMDTPGTIHEFINDTRHLDSHPGTMNFRSRLEKAHLINKRNSEMAMRLDKITPYYCKNDLNATNLKRKQQTNKKGGKLGDTKVSILTNFNGSTKSSADDEDDDQILTSRSEDPKQSSHYHKNKQHKELKKTASTFDKYMLNNIILEYTKIQNNKVLDVVVLKESFKDQYAIYGIDVTSGQRYDLSLDSEDVSNILDGDILVTSPDNIEVWIALLGKVELEPVEEFKRLQLKHAEGANLADVLFLPTEPANTKPSKRPSGRAGPTSGQSNPSTSYSNPFPVSSEAHEKITATSNDKAVNETTAIKNPNQNETENVENEYNDEVFEEPDDGGDCNKTASLQINSDVRHQLPCDVELENTQSATFDTVDSSSTPADITSSTATNMHEAKAGKKCVVFLSVEPTENSTKKGPVAPKSPHPIRSTKSGTGSNSSSNKHGIKVDATAPTAPKSTVARPTSGRNGSTPTPTVSITANEFLLNDEKRSVPLLPAPTRRDEEILYPKEVLKLAKENRANAAALQNDVVVDDDNHNAVLVLESTVASETLAQSAVATQVDDSTNECALEGVATIDDTVIDPTMVQQKSVKEDECDTIENITAANPVDADDTKGLEDDSVAIGEGL